MFPAPQPISELYLGEFLAQLRQEGYSIFVVRGALPAVGGNGMAGRGGEFGRWVAAEEAAAANKQAETVKAAGRARNAAETAMARIGAGGSSTLQVLPTATGGMGRGGGATDDDAELQAAIAASLGQAGGGRMGMGVGMGGADGGVGGGRGARQGSGDDDLARALAASLAGAIPPGGGGGGTKRGASAAGVGGDNGGSGRHDADADLAAAIAASLAEGGGGSSGGEIMVAAAAPIPEEPGPGEPGTVTLAIRVPSGARLQRRFRSSDTVGGVEAYVAATAETDMSRHVLTTAFPRKQLREPGATLKDAGITDKEALSVEPTSAR
jgi:ataxin-3